MSQVINTQGVDGLTWFDFTTSLFSNVIPVFTMTDLAQWREWAMNARRFVPDIPDPFQFADWKTWADRFNLVMVDHR